MDDLLETIEYRGFEIKVFPDYDAMNPWTDWECEPPLFAYHGRRDGTFEYGLDLSLPELTRDEIKANLADIKVMLDSDRLLIGLSNYCYSYRHNYNNVVDLTNDALNELAGSMNTLDKMELVAAVYEMKGIPAYTTTVHGCSQGDWADLLLVATPEWQVMVGAPDDSLRRQLESAAKLYENWAFGNVYGYTIVDPDDDDEILESCWGFYGWDHDESGLLHDAKAAVDYHLENERRKHIESVKKLVKNRVPLETREKLVAHL